MLIDISDLDKEYMYVSFEFVPDKISDITRCFSIGDLLSLNFLDSECTFVIKESIFYPDSSLYPSYNTYPGDSEIVYDWTPRRSIKSFVIEIEIRGAGTQNGSLDIIMEEESGFSRRFSRDDMNLSQISTEEIVLGNQSGIEDEVDFQINDFDIKGYVSSSDIYHSAGYHGLYANGLWRGTSNLSDYTEPVNIRNLANYNYVKGSGGTIPKGILWNPQIGDNNA